MKLSLVALLVLTLTSPLVIAEEQGRVLFDFTGEQAPRQWQTVNDGVMGGRSKGEFEINDENSLKFTGVLSLENNGGFASVRSRPTQLDLQKDDTLVIRVKGDGRTYNFNLYVPTQLTAFSYRVSFQTKKNEWIEVELPLKNFQATWFGREVNNRPLDATRVNRLGVLLSDKKTGPFELQIGWIKVKDDAT
jgi:monofunctional biosynthetic peptidoglycan transglycosylase